VCARIHAQRPADRPRNSAIEREPAAIADRTVYHADGHIVGEIEQSAMDNVAAALKGAKQ